MKTNDIKSTGHVDALREHLEYEIDRFLRGRGWERKIVKTGGFWMWHRLIDGKMFVVNKDTALRIEGSLEAGRCECSAGSSKGCPLHGWEI